MFLVQLQKQTNVHYSLLLKLKKSNILKHSCGLMDNSFKHRQTSPAQIHLNFKMELQLSKTNQTASMSAKQLSSMFNIDVAIPRSNSKL
jgi:hypothetical protein